MLFNSFEFGVFFPIVTFLYFVLPHRLRWAFLLGASCLFYMWFIPQFIFILAGTIVIDYFAALIIERTQGLARKTALIVSIVSTCAILFAFKYFNFFASNYNQMAAALGLNYPIRLVEWILPIGLSFHTFQSLSYVIEVYRGHQKAESHFGIYALYVMFFPQLVAGPIERPQNLLFQFHRRHRFEYDRVSSGVAQIGYGLFKKVVIADSLAKLVNAVYSEPSAFSGTMLLLATIFFAFQIYCDFSGYSDIAVGTARVLGFDLMANFDRPYFSRSVAQFWRRWHISLSTWFKDYVYVSMGGNHGSRWRVSFNLLVTFLFSGIWHGANWTYVAWGLLNGLYLVFAKISSPIWDRTDRFWGRGHRKSFKSAWDLLSTFSLICISWIFFRANTIADAFHIAHKIFSIPQEILNGTVPYSPVGFGRFLEAQVSGLDLIFYERSILLIFGLLMIEMATRMPNPIPFISQRSPLLRWSFYYAIVLLIIFFGVFGEHQFIYFQF